MKTIIRPDEPVSLDRVDSLELPLMYETGAVDTVKGLVMDQGVVEKARQKGCKISRADRFRYRCRYFTDSGVIGCKAFVQDTFDRFKHLLASKDERRFTRLVGVDGVYSMKRLG